MEVDSKLRLDVVIIFLLQLGEVLVTSSVFVSHQMEKCSILEKRYRENELSMNLLKTCWIEFSFGYLEGTITRQPSPWAVSTNLHFSAPQADVFVVEVAVAADPSS